MNRINIIEAARKEHDVINSFKFTPEVKKVLLSTLMLSIEDLINETDIIGDDEFSKSEDLIHLAIAKSFGVYACLPYFSLTGRHKILKPVPHVDGDDHVFMYNDLLRKFKKMSKKQIMKAAIFGMEKAV